MKLILEIVIGRGTTDRLEHDGPTVRIGRDPESEVPFSGEAAAAVSWHHAEIELGIATASIVDCGSTNGTLVNDRKISIRTPLHVGDTIQLGATGPMLKVAGLERSAKPERGSSAGHVPIQRKARPEDIEETQRAPSPAEVEAMLAESAAPAAARSEPAAAETPSAPAASSTSLAYGIVAIAVVIVAILAILVMRQNQRQAAESPPTKADAKEAAGPRAEAAPKQESAAPKQEKSTPTVAAAAPQAPMLVPVSGAPALAPDVERREVGTLIVPPRSPPSVLLQRERAPYPWSPIRAGERVATSQHLVSLPGYRSRVSLDGGMELTLWGNVPEFSPFPVLESTVMLHAPPPGFDLDLTLERGRVHLAQQKKAGEAHVRVRFQRESWDLVLPSPQSEIVVELWNMLPEETPAPQGKYPLTVVGLFTKGPATVKTRERELALKSQSQLTWTDPGATLIGPDSMPKPPEWWVNALDPKSPQVGNAMLALQDYAVLLNKSTAVVDTVLTQVRESPDAPHRGLGVLFLGALDDVPHLVDSLEDRQSPEVRGAAILALRHWLRQSADHEQELFRIFGEQRGYSKEKAKTIVQLLRGFSKQEAAQSKTYAALIADLDHENLGVRQLAFWHLANLAPKEAKQIKYDPAAPAEERKEACVQWKRALPAGALPTRS